MIRRIEGEWKNKFKIIYLGIGQRWVVSFTLQSFYQREITTVPIG
jgi:hypothetical protein